MCEDLGPACLNLLDIFHMCFSSLLLDWELYVREINLAGESTLTL